MIIILREGSRIVSALNWSGLHIQADPSYFIHLSTAKPTCSCGSRALKRLSHASHRNHLSDLILRHPMPTALTAKPTELDTAKSDIC